MSRDCAAELDVCPQCCRPNPVGYHFCDFCNAPLSAAAATMPCWRPWAEGFAVRRAVRQVDSWFVLAGIWVIFAPQVLLMLCFGLPGGIWEMCQQIIHTDGMLVGVAAAVWMLLLVGSVLALYIAILFVATRTFVRQRSHATR